MSVSLVISMISVPICRLHILFSPEFVDLAVADIPAAFLIPKCTCISSCCILSLIATQAHPEGNTWAVDTSRNVTHIAASVIGVLDQLDAELLCYFDKPYNFNSSFWLIWCSHQQKQKNEGDSWNDLHVAARRGRKWIPVVRKENVNIN